MRIYKLVGIVLSALLLLVSCTNSDVDKKKVKIAYANWLEGIAMSHLDLEGGTTGAACSCGKSVCIR